jgi:hypothetical protein
MLCQSLTCLPVVETGGTKESHLINTSIQLESTMDPWVSPNHLYAQHEVLPPFSILSLTYGGVDVL